MKPLEEGATEAVDGFLGDLAHDCAVALDDDSGEAAFEISLGLPA